MRHKHFYLIAAVIATPIVGYGAMYMLVYALPMDGNIWVHVFYTLAIIILGLSVPYWMLKLGTHAAHEDNPREQELQLKNIPKDEDEIKRS